MKSRKLVQTNQGGIDPNNKIEVDLSAADEGPRDDTKGKIRNTRPQKISRSTTKPCEKTMQNVVT